MKLLFFLFQVYPIFFISQITILDYRTSSLIIVVVLYLINVFNSFNIVHVYLYIYVYIYALGKFLLVHYCKW